jgi:hypothetical protein
MPPTSPMGKSGPTKSSRLPGHSRARLCPLLLVLQPALYAASADRCLAAVFRGRILQLQKEANGAKNAANQVSPKPFNQ